MLLAKALDEYIRIQFSFIPTQLVNAAVYDLDGCLLAMTEKSQIDFGGGDGVKLIGKHLPKSLLEADQLENDIQLYTAKFKPSHVQATKEALVHLYKLQQIVARERIICHFISLIPRNGDYQSRLITYIPLFADNGEVMGIQSIAVAYNLFGVQDYLNLLQNKPLEDFMIQSNQMSLPIQLTRRQHEVLFLIANGLSQTEAANILGIQRGTLSSIVANFLCPKFDIAGANTKLLIEKAIEMGYHRQTPQSLCSPYILILDKDLRDRAFD